MELKEINYILSIYRHKNITKASEELFITQPALSKFLKNVEKQVGAPLFSRVGNDLIPTHMGTRYLHYVTRIARLQDDWNMENNDLLGEEKGRLSVAVPMVRSSCIMPDILTMFYRKYPHVQVNLVEESNLVLKHWLNSRDIDFVMYSDIQPHPHLVHRQLGEEEIVLVMKKGHALARYGEKKPGRRYPWMDLRHLQEAAFVVNAPDQTTGKVTHKLFDEGSIRPNILLQTRNTEVAVRLAAAGTALAFSPESYVKKIHTDSPLDVFSVGKDKALIRLYAIHQKGRYLPAYATYFLQLVEYYMQQNQNGLHEAGL